MRKREIRRMLNKQLEEILLHVETLERSAKSYGEAERALMAGNTARKRHRELIELFDVVLATKRGRSLKH